MAFVWAYIIGDSSDGANPVAVKKHGYRAKSIFRQGFGFPGRILPDMSEHIDGFEEAIRAFSRSSIYFFKSHKLCELK